MTVVRNTNGEKIVLLEEQEEIIEKARFCKLDGFAEELQYQFINPLQYQDSSYESRISGCLDSQISANKNAQFNAYFKKSHMPRKYYLSKYQDDPERNLNRKDIQYLKELNYINAGTNIIINGPTGTGKTAGDVCRFHRCIPAKSAETIRIERVGFSFVVSKNTFFSRNQR